MKIVIDSNIIIADYWMESTNFKLLFENQRNGEIQIFFPEVVIDEVLNKFRNRLEKSKSQIESEFRTFSKLSKIDTKNPISGYFIEKAYNDYQNYLNQLIDEKKISILKYPTTEHKYLSKKAIKKRKPFNSNGKGYRDSLIWENIKSLSKNYRDVKSEPDIIFISNNNTDFASKGNEFHEDLVRELSDENIDNRKLKLYLNLSEFNDKIAKLFLKQSVSFSEKLHSDNDKDFDLKRFINNYLRNNFVGEDIYSLGFHRYEEYNEPTVSSFSEDFDLENISIRKLNLDSFLVDVTLDLEIEIDMFLNKNDHYHMDNYRGISVIDSDWNKYVTWVASTENIKLYLSIIIENSLHIVSCQIIRINDNYAQQ
jgi:predicted nucleic acid-binding protein